MAAGLSLGLSAHRAGALSFPPFPRLGDAFGSRPHAQTVAVQLDSSAIMHRSRLQQCICSEFILLVASSVFRLSAVTTSHIVPRACRLPFRAFAACCCALLPLAHISYSEFTPPQQLLPPQDQCARLA